MEIPINDIFRFTDKITWQSDPEPISALVKNVQPDHVLILTWDAVGPNEPDCVAVKATVTTPSGSTAFTEVTTADAYERETSKALDLVLRASDQFGKSRRGAILPLSSCISESENPKADLAKAELVIDLVIDTNHPRFMSLPDKTVNGRQTACFVLSLEVYKPKSKLAQQSLVEIPIQMYPAVTPDYYNGMVAVDLGNTQTAVVKLSNADVLIESDREPLTAVGIMLDGNDKEETVVSALKVNSWSEPLSGPNFPQAEYIIGKFAGNFVNNRAPDGLILGPKRRVVDPRVDLPDELVLNSKPYPYPRHLPAEMFFKRLLSGFIRNSKALPRPLLITYPTTFTIREVEALRLAAYNALRWALGRPDRVTSKDVDDDPDLKDKVKLSVPDPIDEATAAAMYLIYRDDINQPGGVRAFMDKYPNGLYCLIYDCGGGTTDIALVRAECKRTYDKATQHEYFEFHFSVMGRTGMRRLGGDDITLAVFRVLKLKLAHLIAKNAVGFREKGSAPGADDSKLAVKLEKDAGKSWPEFLQATAGIVDDILPTRWKGDRGIGLSHRDQTERQGAALLLWELAEVLKLRLAKGGDAAEKPTTATAGAAVGSTDASSGTAASAVDGSTDAAQPAQPATVSLSGVSQRVQTTIKSLWPTIMRGIRGAWAKSHQTPTEAATKPATGKERPDKKDPEADKDKVRDKLRDFASEVEKISISAEEVDAQVIAAVQESVEMVNRLLEAEKRLPRDTEVERVYLVGNSSRYPLIPQTIARHLKVRFLSDPKRLRRCDNQAKLAVAKGACLHARFADDENQLRLVPPRDLTKRLPYDVVIKAPGVPPRPIFEEGEIPAEVEERSVFIPENVASATQMRLYRRWPGEKEPSKYLRFDFPEEVRGTLQVRFNPTYNKFQMRDRSEWIDGTEEIEAEYVPYVQSGEI